MVNALIFGMVTFTFCWIIHFVIWRVRRPSSYLFWLPLIFIGIPIGLGVLLNLLQLPMASVDISTSWFVLAAGSLLHIALSCCYICGYAGIIEYSPSAEVLLEVQRHMPKGVVREGFRIHSFREYDLTGKRLEHLLRSGFAVEENGYLRLTPIGRIAFVMSLWYRVLLGVPKIGKG